MRVRKVYTSLLINIYAIRVDKKYEVKKRNSVDQALLVENNREITLLLLFQKLADMSCDIFGLSKERPESIFGLL